MSNYQKSKDLFFLCVGFLLMSQSQAATIEVTAQIGEPGCDLVEAINAANSNAPVGGCIANNGSFGADLIVLNFTVPISEFVVSTVNNTVSLGPNGLPIITSDITIIGRGSELVTIKRSDAPGTPNHRLFFVREGGHLTLNRVSLQGGNLDAYDGGAIYAHCDAEVTLNDVELTGNFAENGGAVYLNGSDFCGGTDNVLRMNVFRSLFSDNEATNSGGAIGQAIRNDVAIYDSTISHNKAASGGGLAIRGAPETALSMFNVTIAENEALGRGGGIYIFTSSTSVGNSIKMTNSILSGNTAVSDGQELWLTNVGNLAEISLSNNILGTNNANFDDSVNLSEFLTDNILMTSDAIGSLPLSRIIGRLQDNGGLTRSRAIVGNSPAIDAGIPFRVFGGGPPLFLFFYEPGCTGQLIGIGSPQPYRIDQNGVGRPIGNECDIGAVEYEPEPDQCYVVPTINDTTVVFCL